MSKIKHLYEVSRLREIFTYDRETGVLTRIGKGPAGTLFSTGHLQVFADGSCIGVHRIAWALVTGEYPTLEIDHINGDGTDNRWCNLRLATSSQNNQNRRISTRNKSGVKGVFRVKNGKPWRVAIRANGKYHITQFDDFDMAVLYAAELREHLHGEFARAA